MTPHQFIALAVRLFALWLALTATQIGLLAFALRSATRQGGEASWLFAGIYLLLAIGLWCFPLVLARRLLPAGDPGPAVQFAGATAAAVAFVAAGLLIIALKALTPVANYISLLSMMTASGQGARLQSPALHVDGVIGLVMFLIGAVLVIKCRTLARRVLPERT